MQNKRLNVPVLRHTDRTSTMLSHLSKSNRLKQTFCILSCISVVIASIAMMCGAISVMSTTTVLEWCLVQKVSVGETRDLSICRHAFMPVGGDDECSTKIFELCM